MSKKYIWSFKNTLTINIESNQELNITLGKSEKNLTVKEKELQMDIVDRINHSLNNICIEWINDFLQVINEGNIEKAYRIFEEKKGLLSLSKNKEDLINLRKLNYNLLEQEKRKKYLMSLVAFSSKLNVRDEITMNNIDSLLNEFSNELEKDFVQNLRLEKANISAQKEHINTATSMYKKIIEEPNTDPGTLAYAYQGLSLIADNDYDKIYFTEKAYDKHLESGNIFESIKNIIKISDMKSNNDPDESIRLLDLALSLNDKNSLINQELLASLLFKKASYLYKINKKDKAYDAIKESCSLRENLLGNEIYYYSSLSLAYILAKENNEFEESEIFKDKQNEISKYIKDSNFILRLELASCIENKKEVDNALEQKVIDSKDNTLKCGLYLIKSLNKDLHKDEKLELLDNALYVAKKYDREMLSNIYFAIAEVYRNENDINDALINYKQSLKQNFYYKDAFQNCINMLINKKDWDNAEILLKERIERIGELPNICYIYGKVLCEKGIYRKALKYLTLANKNIKDLNDYKLKCIENMDDAELDSINNEQIINNQRDITINDLHKALKEFSVSISSDSRMHFWKFDRTKKEYKWTNNPEELSKQFLIQFLNAKFGKENIDINPEVRAGAGFIDLYITLNGGLKVIIELKMCGCGYSSSYAISGEEQIIHYQKNKNTKIGFLIVFDARKRDFSKGFKEVQTFEDHTIYSISIDMRTKVK